MCSKQTITIYSQTKYYLLGAVLVFVGFSGSLTHFFFSRFEAPFLHVSVLIVFFVIEVACLYRSIKPRVLLKFMKDEIWTHKSGAYLWTDVDRISFEEGYGNKGRKVFTLVINLKAIIPSTQEHEKITYNLQDLNVRNEEVAILIEQYLGETKS